MIKKLLSVIAIAGLLVGDIQAKGYSSGSHSSSSFSSSRSSSSFSPSRSSYGASSGSSYSSRPSSSYTSTSKSYSGSSVGSGKTYSAGSNSKPSSFSFSPSKKSSSPSSSSGFSFDSGASRAAKEVASQKSYQQSKELSIPRPSSDYSVHRSSDYSTPRPSPSYPTSRPRIVTQTYVHYYPTIVHESYYRTRPTRWNSFYGSYTTRPMVSYNDPISSAFWWWLLDQSIEERAMWAYHNQNQIDSARYQALLNSDAALRSRVAEMEAQNVARNPAYVPTALAQNPDLMLSDSYVDNAYATRPTASGKIMFWIFMFPLAVIAVVGTFWLLFVKKWQTA